MSTNLSERLNDMALFDAVVGRLADMAKPLVAGMDATLSVGARDVIRAFLERSARWAPAPGTLGADVVVPRLPRDLAAEAKCELGADVLAVAGNDGRFYCTDGDAEVLSAATGLPLCIHANKGDSQVFKVCRFSNPMAGTVREALQKLAGRRLAAITDVRLFRIGDASDPVGGTSLLKPHRN